MHLVEITNTRFGIDVYVCNHDSSSSNLVILCYVAQVSGTRVCWEHRHEYPIRLEASPKFAGNVGLGAAIIYINFFKIY